MSEETQPDYSSYSYKELKACLDGINKTKYPERAHLIERLLSNSEKNPELKKRDYVKENVSSKEETYIHFAFEVAILLVILIVGCYSFFSWFSIWYKGLTYPCVAYAKYMYEANIYLTKIFKID